MKMMKFAGILTLPLMFSFLPYMRASQRLLNSVKDEGIQFEKKGWNYALTEAKNQNKLVFLDAYTSWCGPCKLLKKNTFTDKAVGEFFNKNFVNVTEDMEKGVGIQLAAKYQVNAFPTLLITDGDGNLITYTKGYLSPEQLLDFGKHGVMSKPNSK